MRICWHVECICEFHNTITAVADGPSSVTLVPPGPLTKVENDSVSVDCSADCNPDCTYTWTPRGDSDNGHLYINRIHRSQAGDYTCEARNELEVDSETETLTIEVQYPPGVHVTLEPETVVEGQTATVVCTADGNPNSNTFQWRNVTGDSDPDGEIDPSDTQSILTVEDAKCQKRSQIQCSATNSVGPSPIPAIAELDVQCKWARIGTSQNQVKVAIL